MHKNAVKKAGQSEEKAGQQLVNFELKIGTVPLKAGQLESMDFVEPFGAWRLFMSQHVY